MCRQLSIIILSLFMSTFSFAQSCGQIYLFNFTDTLVTDSGWFEEPQPGFYFDMTFDTMFVGNTGYTTFMLINDTGDTLTNLDYYAWSHTFPYNSIDTQRYTMVFANGLTSLPSNFNGYIQAINPDCQIPISLNMLSNNDISTNKLPTAYPNPTNGLLHLPINHAITNIHLYNSSGQLITQQNSPTLDLSTLPNGLYFLATQLDDQTIHTQKIIKY